MALWFWSSGSDPYNQGSEADTEGWWLRQSGAHQVYLTCFLLTPNAYLAPLLSYSSLDLWQELSYYVWCLRLRTHRLTDRDRWFLWHYNNILIPMASAKTIFARTSHDLILKFFKCVWKADYNWFDINYNTCNSYFHSISQILPCSGNFRLAVLFIIQIFLDICILRQQLSSNPSADEFIY